LLERKDSTPDGRVIQHDFAATNLDKDDEMIQIPMENARDRKLLHFIDFESKCSRIQTEGARNLNQR